MDRRGHIAFLALRESKLREMMTLSGKAFLNGMVVAYDLEDDLEDLMSRKRSCRGRRIPVWAIESSKLSTLTSDVK